MGWAHSGTTKGSKIGWRLDNTVVCCLPQPIIGIREKQKWVEAIKEDFLYICAFFVLRTVGSFADGCYCDFDRSFPRAVLVYAFSDPAFAHWLPVKCAILRQGVFLERASWQKALADLERDKLLYGILTFRGDNLSSSSLLISVVYRKRLRGAVWLSDLYVSQLGGLQINRVLRILNFILW